MKIMKRKQNQEGFFAYMCLNVPRCVNIWIKDELSYFTFIWNSQK